MNIDIILLVLMTLAALWTVMGRSLLKATIGLAVTSAIITILMFRLDSPMAAVFELSVCTGLMTVIFVSTISLTKPLTHKEVVALSKARMKRFWYLPLILILLGAGLSLIKLPNYFAETVISGIPQDMRQVLWNSRQLDIFGQIIIIIAGALGVVILFEERRKDEW